MNASCTKCAIMKLRCVKLAKISMDYSYIILYISFDVSIIVKVCLYYKYFNRAMYDWLHYFCGEWEGWALLNRFNHTSWVTAVTPTDRPKLVHNSCVIKVFGGVFMLSRCFLDCSVGVGFFVTRLSQISSFFSY